ncbi:PTS galactitol transporter subunit IIA [Chelonobacter oris]|nr:PTS galactitol transporter subunit IIA [Chelonobacter oris]
MMSSEILIETDVNLHDFNDTLDYIVERLIGEKLVKPSYHQAIFEREKNFPTGIALEKHAVAIPHCEAEHALKPAIYFIRPTKSVAFNRADEEGTINAELIIALVVTDPKEQLKVLRILFGKLQDDEFVTSLLTADDDELTTLIHQNLTF